MPGVIRLLTQNRQRSVRAAYSYRNKYQMRSIIMLWQNELGERMNKYWVHVMPDVEVEPETIKEYEIFITNTDLV